MMATGNAELDGRPDSLQPWLERVLVAMGLLALLATTLRIQSRRLNQQALWWDDWLAIGNMVWLLATISFFAGTISLGLGRHIEYVSPNNIATLVKMALVIDILYIWSLVWSKISVLLLYYRVFRFGYFKTAVYALGAFVVVLAIVSTVLTCILCVPLRKAWDKDVPGYCLSEENLRIFNSASAIFTDIVILCLPIAQIWRLQLRKSEKAGLICYFALGSFVVFATAYRISVLIHDTNRDISYSIAPDAGWTVLELSAAVVSASMPTMGPAIVEAWSWLRLHWYELTRRSGNMMNQFSLCKRRDRDGNFQATRREGELEGSRGQRSGSLYRLADLNSRIWNLGVRPPAVNNVSTSSEKGQLNRAEGGSAAKATNDDASDEVPFSFVQVRTGISQTSTRMGA